MRFTGPWILAALALGAAAPGARETEPPARPEPIHADPAAVESGLGEALRAFLVHDGRAARKALDAIEENCRRLGPDEQPGYPSKVVSWDVAFHRDLDVAREMALRGELDRAYDRFTFLPRGCMGCHDDAAKEGVPGVPGVPRAPATTPQLPQSRG